MSSKQSQCKKCGALHSLGLVNMTTGETEPLSVCRHCMYEFRPITHQVHLNADDMPEIVDPNVLNKKLGNILLNTMAQLTNTMSNASETAKISDLQCEYGCSEQFALPDVSNVTISDMNGNEMEIKCKCGNEATSIIMGKESYLGLCNKCQFGE